MTEEFVPQTCPKCGSRITEMRDGQVYIKRCICDWARGFEERLKKTVHPEYRQPAPGKTILDWDPPLFNDPHAYAELMEVQKLAVIKRIFRFCFEKTGTDQVTGWPEYSLNRNIRSNRTLFIRGPANSGRGLLAAVVKVQAAIRDVSVSPLPSDFDLFKMNIVESEAFGMTGDEAKMALYERYEEPDLMVVENMRAEVAVKTYDKQYIKKFRGASSIDSLLARRTGKPGAMLLTSTDFAGEIDDSLGERLREILDSNSTDMILMLHPKESWALKNGMFARKKLIDGVLEKYRNEGKERRVLPEKSTQQEDMRIVEDGLYFEEVFDAFGSASRNMPVATSSITTQISGGDKALSSNEKLKNVYAKFSQAKATNGFEYEDGVRQAKTEAVKSCPELALRLTYKEMEIVGNMLSVATKIPGPHLDRWRIEADRLKDIMVGRAEQ